jgi:aspartokinase/homoserine dehydrogenase 1
VIVMKFGGSSVADLAMMRRVAGIIAAGGEPVAVVVSAMGKTTDALFRAAELAERGEGEALRSLVESLRRSHQEALPGGDEATPRHLETLWAELESVLHGMMLLREQTPRSRALVASIGERLSAPILAAHLGALGKAAVAVDARSFVITDDQYEAGRVEWAETAAAAAAVLRPLVERGTIPVVTGFIGATRDGITTTLGRGGSDYTAALVGSLLDAREVWIWTDVDGILTADPRLVKEARTLPQVSYREAAEMSYFGAKVLHPKTILPAVARGIPLRIKNTFHPDHPGTLITAEPTVLPQTAKTVTSIPGLALVTVEGRGMAGVPGVARRVFEATEAAGVNVIMISQASSEQAISFVVLAAEADRLARTLGVRFAAELATGAIDRIDVEGGIAIATIVGQGMAGTPGVSGKLFGALGDVGVNVLAIAQGASELSISVAVEEREVQRAVRAIHSAFGLTRIVDLLVLGCGRVGRAFLRILRETRSDIEANLGLDLRLVGLADSRHLRFDDAGLDPDEAAAELKSGPPRPDDVSLVERLVAGRFTDMVLVDLTSAEGARIHELALGQGIHVVTANKRPLSGSLSRYDAIFAAARRTGARVGYETTFGAGLPVLHTLQELLHTGDRIDRVSGCFSGTLGYLTTRLEDGASLRTALAEAKSLGLTEPDPRDDLSGQDVARKALIIARTIGLRLEPEAVRVEPLLPDLEEGLEVALARHEAALAARVAQAALRGEVLRYVAEIAAERTAVGLKAVPKHEPIGALRGPDNILVYRTERYRDYPLTIRGPGAGPEVTAAGVLGDVLKAARR